MAKILVTGSNGFAGRYVTEALVRHGHEVIGLAKNRAIHPNAVLSENHLIDLTDQTALMALVSSVQPDQVVHLAAISFVAHDRAEDIYTNNVIGTRNLLEALAQLDNFHGPLLMVSSANVYGGATAGMVSETALTVPVNDYGLSKLAAEHLTRIYHARVPSIVVRPFNYTGVGQPDHFLIPKIVSHVRSGTPVIELGNIDVSRDFSDVRFFAEVCALLLNCPGAIGETINICSGRAFSLADILTLLQNLTGHKIEVRINPNFVRDNEVKQLWGNPAKLHSLIGSLENPPLVDTLAWMLSQQDKILVSPR